MCNSEVSIVPFFFLNLLSMILLMIWILRYGGIFLLFKNDQYFSLFLLLSSLMSGRQMRHVAVVLHFIVHI